MQSIHSPFVPVARAVTLTAPARLHMGFVDLDGSLGRRFGSIGVPLNEIATVLTLEPAEQFSATGPDCARAERYVYTVCAALGITPQLRLTVSQAIPEHVGLGSGTQMALAVVAAIDALYGLGLSMQARVELTGRGARSGIGIAAFQEGGVVVDGGRGPNTVIPPVIARLSMPEAWRFILVFDERGQGLHGAAEGGAFDQLPAFPAAQSAYLSHLLLMRGLPALVENDLVAFGAAITELQRIVGDYFAPAQGGRFTSPAVAALLAELEAHGAVGIGQSSWGPTGFCLVESPEQAQALVARCAERAVAAGLSVRVASCRERGAELSVR